jgi:hypothetical protein
MSVAAALPLALSETPILRVGTRILRMMRGIR